MQIDDTLCKEFVKSVNFQDVRLNNLNVNKNKDISNKEQQGVEVRLEFLLDKYDCFMEEKRFLVYPCFKLT